MEIENFYTTLGELCRAHGARKFVCDDCPASRFCYTTPGSVTKTMLDEIIAAVLTQSADAARMHKGMAFPKDKEGGNTGEKLYPKE